MLQNILPRTKETFHGILSVVEDGTFIAKLFALFLAFLTPLHTVFGVMLFFLMMDTITAVYLRFRINLKRQNNCKSPNINEATRKIRCWRLLWRSFEKEKFGKTIEKMVSYPIIVLCCFVFDILVLQLHPGDDGLILRFSLTSFAFVLICFYDLQSILRNMGKATDNKIYQLIENLLAKKVEEHYPYPKQKK